MAIASYLQFAVRGDAVVMNSRAIGAYMQHDYGLANGL